MRDLGWYSAIGHAFRVEAEGMVADILHESLSDMRMADNVHDGHEPVLKAQQFDDEWSITWDGHARYEGSDRQVAVYDCLVAINVYAARVAARNGMAVLHGGAVDIGGTAVAFVGHSGAGKSTLTAAMVREGHAYLADEVVALDDLIVQPFHRPIGLRARGGRVIGVDLPDGSPSIAHPHRIGGVGALAGPRPLGAIVLLRRQEERVASATLHPVRQAQALFELTNQTLGATDVERAMFRRLDRLVRTVPLYELHYSEVASAIGVVENLAVDASDAPTVAGGRTL
jgi:energy-coupling factor transporter ATP-binding protein EcfA2